MGFRNEAKKRAKDRNKKNTPSFVLTWRNLHDFRYSNFISCSLRIRRDTKIMSNDVVSLPCIDHKILLETIRCELGRSHTCDRGAKRPKVPFVGHRIGGLATEPNLSIGFFMCRQSHDGGR